MANFINNNLVVIFSSFSAILLIFFIFIIVLGYKFSKLKEKYNYFMGDNNKDKLGVPIEVLLTKYIDEVRAVRSENTDLKNTVDSQQLQLSKCIQKFATVRYNPFEQMGGNQCFAIALLDSNDNGVVINGIHANSGSYTYGKPIEKGESSYTLSDEEIQAIDLARGKTNKK